MLSDVEKLLLPGELRRARRDRGWGLERAAKAIGVSVEELSQAERGSSPDIKMQAARFYAEESPAEPKAQTEGEAWTPEAAVDVAPGLESLHLNSRTYYLWLLLRYERDHFPHKELEEKFNRMKVWGRTNYQRRTREQMKEEIWLELAELLEEE